MHLMWVRVNYKVMSVYHHFQQYFSYIVSVMQFIMVEETGVPRIVLYNVE